MKRRTAIALMTIIGAWFWATPKEEVLVAAGASLKDALGEAISVYEAANPRVSIIATYASSGSIQKQIEQGAPIDVFIPAGIKQMDILQSEGLVIPSTRVILLTNRVVLIVPISAGAAMGFADAGGVKVRQIALGEPGSVPAGQYAEQIFKSLGILEAVRAKAVYGKDVRQVLAYVEAGEVDAGVVYATDAAASKKVRIAAFAPEGSHEPVQYPAAIVATGPNAEGAKAFLAWLAGPQGAAIFARYGFGTR